MACDHREVYDAVFTNEEPAIAIRQCINCRWWTKVYDHKLQVIEQKEVEQYFELNPVGGK